jgi:type IV pilus assembly protein PilO
MNNINLNELTLENVGDWPMPVKIAASVILSLIIIALGYWFIVKPNFAQYDSLAAQEKTLKQQFELKERQASNLNAYRKQLAEMQEKFGNMLQKLPAKHEMPALLENISKTGIASGLKFELFAPQPEVKHDFYIEMPIKLAVVGNYHEIAVFLSRVAKMDRIVTMHDFTLEPYVDNGKGQSAKSQGNGNVLMMNMTAKIYRYRSQ